MSVSCRSTLRAGPLRSVQSGAATGRRARTGGSPHSFPVSRFPFPVRFSATPDSRNGRPSRRREGRPLRESGVAERSEEHTSELQSRRDLVCRLLLEKKKSLIAVELNGSEVLVLTTAYDANGDIHTNSDLTKLDGGHASGAVVRVLVDVVQADLNSIS